jgi:hypothetical protein
VIILFGCVLLCPQREILIHFLVVDVLSLDHILMQLLPSLDQLSIVVVLLLIFSVAFIIIILVTFSILVVFEAIVLRIDILGFLREEFGLANDRIGFLLGTLRNWLLLLLLLELLLLQELLLLMQGGESLVRAIIVILLLVIVVAIVVIFIFQVRRLLLLVSDLKVILLLFLQLLLLLLLNDWRIVGPGAFGATLDALAASTLSHHLGELMNDLEEL